jgi:hypothetical protein
MDKTSSRAESARTDHHSVKARAGSSLLNCLALRGKEKPRSSLPIGVSDGEGPRRGSSNHIRIRASHNRRPLSTAFPQEGLHYHRRDQFNKADRHYQNTRKGRRAHSKRQEAYRRRQRLAGAETSMQKVTDQGLGKPRRFATVSIAEGIMSQMTKQPTSRGQAIEKKPRHGFARCSVCGRLGFPLREGGE